MVRWENVKKKNFNSTFTGVDNNLQPRTSCLFDIGQQHTWPSSPSSNIKKTRCHGSKVGVDATLMQYCFNVFSISIRHCKIPKNFWFSDVFRRYRNRQTTLKQHYINAVSTPSICWESS